MSDRDRALRKEAAKMRIYRSACMKAIQLLIAPGAGAGWLLVEGAKDLLVKATHDAAKVDMWVPIKHVPYGALFESQSGLRFIKTTKRTLHVATCIALFNGVPNQLDVNMLVRVLTIKED